MLLSDNSEWEDMVIFLSKDQAINESIKFPNRRVEIFIKENESYVPSYNYIKNGIAKQVKGKANARAYYENYVTRFSDRKFIIKETFADGDKLVKHWEFKGKHTGTFFGIPATGKDVDLFGVTIVKMKGGKIAEEQDFMDNLEFMQQLGLMPR